MENEKKYILISGATSGFGEATARLFASRGWNLILTGRRIERLEQLKHDLCAALPELNCFIACFDIRDPKAVDDAIQKLPKEALLNTKILLNNAGLALGRAPFDDADMNDWEQMLDTNVKGLLYLSRAIIPYFKENKQGHIINISSIAGKEVYPDGNVYCASKHAVDAISQAMRMDLLKHGIKISNLAPGAANTEFSMVRFKGDRQTAEAVYKGYDPLIAEDIAETIWFMASRPAHVNIADLTILPAAQASGTIFHKK